jgi:hypothetical protein
MQVIRSADIGTSWWTAGSHDQNELVGRGRDLITAMHRHLDFCAKFAEECRKRLVSA